MNDQKLISSLPQEVEVQTMHEDLEAAKKTEKSQKPEKEKTTGSFPEKYAIKASKKGIKPLGIIKILGGLVVVFLLIIGGKLGYDHWFAAPPEEVVEPTYLAQPALVELDGVMSVFLGEGEDLKENLKTAIENLEPKATQLIVYRKAAEGVLEVSPIELADLLFEMELRIPEALQARLNSEYMMYVSIVEDDVLSKYRLNFILSVTDIETIEESLLAWETSILDDLSDLHLLKSIDQLMEEDAEMLEFQDVQSQGINIRYVNVFDKYTAFDYAIVPEKEILLINTNKESMFNIIDRIAEIKAIDIEDMGDIIEESDLLEDEMSIEMTEATITEEIILEDAVFSSRNTLVSFGEALIIDDLTLAISFAQEDKKIGIEQYLTGIGLDNRIILGNKILNELSVVYEKSDIALYEIDCPFINMQTECSFYLNKIGEEWKIIQL